MRAGFEALGVCRDHWRLGSHHSGSDVLVGAYLAPMEHRLEALGGLA
jgi:hypothetical protein